MPNRLLGYDGEAVKGFFQTKEQAQARFDICSQCPKLKKPIDLCSECNCLMRLKVKITKAHCPIGKW